MVNVQKCTIEGCEKQILIKSRGLCGMHNARIRRHGTIDLPISRTVKHMMTNTKIYGIWQAMKDRCTNPNNSKYHLYGGTGITVCKRWINSFESFYEDVGPRPSERHSLDRYPNNNGNYGPDNVRWATIEKQNQNLRCNNREDVGVTRSRYKHQKWRAAISVNNKTVFLGKYETKEEAIKARKAAELKYWV